MFVWPWCWSICICVFTYFFLYWPFLVTKDALCWAQLMILVVLWQILLIRYWFTLFFLVKPFQIYLQAPSYLMRHWTTSYHRADLEKFFFSILQFSFIVSCLYFFFAYLYVLFLRQYFHINFVFWFAFVIDELCSAFSFSLFPGVCWIFNAPGYCNVWLYLFVSTIII